MAHSPQHTDHLKKILREKHFRITTSKVKLLALLEHVGKPLSVQKIIRLWDDGTPPDTVTLYRSLTDLHGAGIIHRTDLNTGIAHFEYTPDRPHHHHIVCNSCGVVEEIKECALSTLESKIISTSKQFTAITTHTLEFFGHCKKCTPV